MISRTIHMLLFIAALCSIACQKKIDHAKTKYHGIPIGGLAGFAALNNDFMSKIVKLNWEDEYFYYRSLSLLSFIGINSQSEGESLRVVLGAFSDGKLQSTEFNAANMLVMKGVFASMADKLSDCENQLDTVSAGNSAFSLRKEFFDLRAQLCSALKNQSSDGINSGVLKNLWDYYIGIGENQFKANWLGMVEKQLNEKPEWSENDKLYLILYSMWMNPGYLVHF